MVSLQRRQVLKLLTAGGLSAAVVPSIAWSFEAPEKQGKLVLSGRVVDRDGSPVRFRKVTVSQHDVVTDADGRFVLATQQGRVDGAHRDADGTWRGSVALTL